MTQATNLGGAMLSLPGPTLAVLDPDLCDALEHEFAEHLLHINQDAIVLVVSDGPLEPVWPARAR